MAACQAGLVLLSRGGGYGIDEVGLLFRCTGGGIDEVRHVE